MGKKICVLEDDEYIREIITILLEEENYDVYGFSTVLDLTSTESHPKADLYILDMMLPDGNGIDVFKRLKECEKTKDIPILMMSAHSSTKEIECLCKADGFVAKPFDIYDLMKTVTSTINIQI